MTRDVFKYFKYVRSLQEATGSEKALELGYQHQARGVYIDPKTQKRYKNVGDKLEPIVVEPTAEKGGGQQKPDTKSLGQFNKDATGTQPEVQPTALPQIPDGVSDDEFAAAKAKEFTGGRNVTPERKEFLKKVANTQVAMMKQPEPEVEEEPDEQEPEGLDDLLKDVRGEEPKKTVDDFPTLDDKIAETESNNEIDSLLDTIGMGEDTPEKNKYLSQQEQPELTEVQMQNEDERRQDIINSLEMMMQQPEKKKGVGANRLSRDDSQLLKTYIEGNGPEIVKMEISDDDMAFAKDYLKKNHKGAFTKLTLGSKGAPKERYPGRGDAVLKSYLANKGLSAVTGKPLSYFASELDHVISLGNGGVDGFDNWAWVDKRYNQFMSSLDDEGVLKKIDKLVNANPDDEKLKELKGELSNEVRNRYGTYFRTNGTAGVSLDDIEEAKGIGGEQMLKALASATGVSTYKGSDDRTRARGRFIGYSQLKESLIKKLNPVSRKEMKEFDESLNDIRDFIEVKNKEMEPFTKKGRKKKSATKVKEAYDNWYKIQKPGRMIIENLKKSLRDPF